MPHLLYCRAAFVILCAALGSAAAARADDPTPIQVTLRDHRFQPAEIHVHAGQRAVLIVRNEDATADEFDSSALHVEKVIAPGTYAKIWLHPLGPGRYPFMGEFHPDTAQGVVISE